MSRLQSRLNIACSVSIEEVGGKLWVMWAAGMHVSLVDVSKQHITVIMSDGDKNDELPWIIVGDFNAIRYDSERRGGNPRPVAVMDEFNEFIEFAGFMELRFEGNQFSWCNGHEGLVDGLGWIGLWTSDHAPILIQLEEVRSSYGFLAFKFHQMWVTHDSFLSCIATTWEDDIVDYGMARLARKLKRLKPILRVWNREVFGNIQNQIGHLKERLAMLESKLQGEFNEEDEQDYLAAKAKLDEW
ncbi:uncharacterized protein LOC118345290, partial [Juglans regia]|uniref:Uncharacterized protein LOC118345290 n=1 Tax=Juglans regia TaxID=51240 RepID=A0A6P9EF06_JUGRE